LTPGQTVSPLWHEPSGYPITSPAGYDLWRTILLLWAIAGLITGGTLINGIGMADLVTSSVTGDGSVMSSSTLLSGENIITGRLFGSGWTSIDRETESGDTSSSRLLARSVGPLIIGEYASAEKNRNNHPIACVFGNTTEDSAQSETDVSGIIRNGSYASLHTLQPFEHITTADGTGLLDLRHRLARNGTISGRTLVSGNLSVSEQIRGDSGDMS